VDGEEELGIWFGKRDESCNTFVEPRNELRLEPTSGLLERIGDRDGARRVSLAVAGARALVVITRVFMLSLSTKMS